MGPEDLQSGIWRELADVLGKPHCSSLERSWCLGAGPEDGKEAHTPRILKTMKREDLGKERLFRLPSFPIKVLEDIVP